MLHRRFTIALLLTGAGVHAQIRAAEAAEYHVTPTGDDEATGGAGHPWKTLQRATRLRPGDVVVVHAGTYDAGDKGIYVEKGGTAEAPIVYRAADGEKVVVSGAKIGTVGSPFVVAVDHVEIRGFEIKDSPRAGINVFGGNGVRIVGNVVRDNAGAGIWVAPKEQLTDPPVKDVLIEKNTVFHNSLSNKARNVEGGWPGAITGQNTANLRVLRNVVYENYGEGIVFNLTTGSLATGNVVYDNFSCGLYMDNAQDSTFEANLVYSTGKSEYTRRLAGVWKPASGIQMANEKYALSMPLKGNRVVNNIVVGGFASFFYGNYQNGGGMRDTLVANNTFYGPTEELLHIDAGGHGATFVNNVFHGGKGPARVYVQNGAGLTFKNNAWEAATAGAAAGGGDVRGALGLAKPGGLAAADYKIGGTAAAIVGKGSPVPEVKLDFFGGARSAPLDIGAHQLAAVAPPAERPGAPEPRPAPPTDAGVQDAGRSRDGGAAPDATATTPVLPSEPRPRADAGAAVTPPAMPEPGRPDASPPSKPAPVPSPGAPATVDEPGAPEPAPSAGGGCAVAAASGAPGAFPALLAAALAALLRRRRR